MSNSDHSRANPERYPEFSAADDARLFAMAGEGDPVDAPDTQKFDWIKAGLKFLGVNLGAFVVFKMLDCFEALAQEKKSGCDFLSPEQKKNLQLSVNQLAKLSDVALWQRLAGWNSPVSLQDGPRRTGARGERNVGDEPLPTPPAQYETVHFLQRARARSSEFSMATHDKEALINQLVGMEPDAAMYTFLGSYKYQGDAVPFSYGAGLLLSALLKKYPTDFQH